MLLDPETLELAPGVERLLGPEGLKTELFSCLVETNTPVCESASEAQDELVRLRHLVAERAARENLVVAASGSHPFSIPEEQPIVDEPRYVEMVEELGPIAKGQLVCGLHVHVGMESFDACLRALAGIRPWLSAVLGLSANSPYLAGEETGALSSRLARLRRLPRARPAAAAGDGGGVGGGSRRGRRRLHADLVGRTSASPARDARGQNRRSGDVRRPGGRGRRSRTGALCSSAGAGDASSRRDRACRTGARYVGARRDAARAAGGAAAARGRAPRRPEGGRRRPGGAVVNGLRSVLYPLRLVGARLGRRSAPVVLVVLGIAAGASVVFGGRAGTLVAQDRAVAQAVERIPEGSRSVRAVWFGVPAQSNEPQPALERRARAALAARRRRPARRRSSSSARRRSPARSPASAASRGSADWVTLRSGRLPRPCTPERCEVLRLRGEGRLPHPAGLRIVEVGEAVLNNRVLFGDFLAPTDNALADAEVSPSVARAAGYHRPAAAAALPRRGRADARRAPALDTLFRSYAWVVPLRPGQPRLWEVDDLAAGVAQARSELQSVTSSFDLVAPVEELREAQATSRAAGRRLGIVGGEAAALLFAFALLAAMTLRTDLAAARRRLAWYGARGWQLALVTVAESGALAVAGTAIGLAVGALGGALVARAGGCTRLATCSPAASSPPKGSGWRCSSLLPRPASSSAPSRRGRRAPGSGSWMRRRSRRSASSRSSSRAERETAT